MSCKHLSKCLNGKLRCKLLKQQIILAQCKECLNFEPRKNLAIKKCSVKRIKVKDEVYNAVLERDKYCQLQLESCCEGGLELHHILYRSERKDLINDVDNCIMLCVKHHDLVHSDKHYWQPKLMKMIGDKK